MSSGRILTACALVCGLSSATPSAAASKAVVFAKADSPYRTLAQDIAEREAISLVDSVSQALALRPEYLLWVVSPTELSDEAVTSFSLALDRAPSRPSAGLITGSTIERARHLYLSAGGVRGQRAAAIVGEDAFTAARLVETAGGARETRSLSTPAEVLDLLRRVDYVHYSGHGGSGYWRPLSTLRVTGNDVFDLRSVIVSAMSCQTTRIWEPGSIALRMVDAGAAAYSGFYYSPMAGYQIDADDGPFRHSWPDVPIGHVVAAMNEGARKGYAAFSFHLLLGDPRIALNPRPPCRLQDRGEADGIRTLSCPDAPAGQVPLRIPGGARYTFVDVSGITTAWERGPFYNNRLQMATIGDDRILLIDHRGGDLLIRARKRPTTLWLATDPLADASDALLVSMADRRHGGNIIALLLAAIALPLTVARWRRDRSGGVRLVPAAAVGIVAAFLHAWYGLSRQHALVVTDKTIVFSLSAAIATGLLVSCGAFLFHAARTWRGRLSGTLVATSAGWVGGLIVVTMTTAMNLAIAARTGTGAWIYSVPIYPFVLSAIGCGICALAFRATGRIAPRVPRRRRRHPDIMPGSGAHEHAVRPHPIDPGRADGRRASRIEAADLVRLPPRSD